jgi:hypothetical protein
VAETRSQSTRTEAPAPAAAAPSILPAGFWLALLTLWLPVIALIGAVIHAVRPFPFYYHELGIIENLTVVFLVGAVVALVRFASRHFKAVPRLDRALLVILVLGCIYFAGEELSWGQHLVGFKTPGEYHTLNKQKEMNLHNLEHGFFRFIFDRAPRTGVTVGVLVSGIILPFFRPAMPAWIRRYIPGKAVVPTAVLAVFVSVPDKIFAAATGTRASIDSGEMKEFYIALYILLFSLTFLAMLRAELRGGDHSPS